MPQKDIVIAAAYAAARQLVEIENAGDLPKRPGTPMQLAKDAYASDETLPEKSPHIGALYLGAFCEELHRLGRVSFDPES